MPRLLESASQLRKGEMTSSLGTAVEMRGETCGQAIEGGGKNWVQALALPYAGQVTWPKLANTLSLRSLHPAQRVWR